jgi:alcohol dehydrogenase (cytochrome c)
LGAAALADYIAKWMPPAAAGSLPPSVTQAAARVVARANGLDLKGAAAAPPHLGAAAADPEKPTVTTEALEGMTIAPDSKDVYFRAVLARRQALLAHMSPVSETEQSSPPAKDWLMWRQGRDTLGYSALDQIDRTNVAKLRLGWAISLASGTNGIAPIVHDGVMLLNASGTVMALDATSGDVLWTYRGTQAMGRFIPISQPRGIALYKHSVIVPTMDGHMLALDALTGKVIWDKALFEAGDGLQLTAAPLIVRDKIIQGVSGCSGNAHAGGCYIVAINADTGAEVWRFNTISRPGMPGGDSWNGAPVDQRQGGSVWITGSYDPTLDLLFFGTGQTYDTATLLEPNARKGESADALFTDSTLALDPDTGKLKWFYQHLPGDVWDLDWAFEQTLMTIDTPNGPRRVVVTGGKDSIFDVLDAKTGRYLFSQDMGIQTLVSAIDPKTGRKTINPAAKFGKGKGGFVCPFIVGGRDWPSTSYDPEVGLLFIPMVESCMEITQSVSEADLLSAWQLRPPRDNDGKFGRLAALDIRNRKIVWTNRRRAPPSSAMLATAGGLLFEGSRDRTFRALDRDTGQTLWETALSDPPNSFPLTYSVDGTQYVAVVLGGNTPQDILYRGFTPEIASSNGARSVWVFKLAK